MKTTRPLNLIVGCGGSGLTTIESLNRLLVQNPELLPRMKDEIYYIAVDTEKAALDTFEKEIEQQMGRYEPPFIKRIQLSHNIGILNDVIRPKFVEPFAKAGDKGLERLREHWWFDKNNVPFMAPKVKNLPKGAGQCPPASYGLAWCRLREIGEAVKAAVDRMVGRGFGNPAQLSEMNLIVVAGLSGGTGRGCWSLITFKIREYLLERYHVTVPPIGIFFDANVFGNVANLNPGQKLALQVNSATGISELSCWMKNGGVYGSDCFKYRVPDMDSPADVDTDVLKVDLDLNPNAGAPVDSAYLICGQSRSAILNTNAQYHEMAGAAIYAMITNPEISARDVNNNDPYNSLGASTFEVNTLRIHAYFEARARSIALGNLARSSDDVSTDVDAFFAENPINAIVLDAETGLRPDPEGSVYKRAAAAILSGKVLKANFAKIISAMPSWKLADAKRSILPLVKSANEKEIAEAVSKALSGFGLKDAEGRPLGFSGKNGEAAIVAAMKRVYRGTAGQKPSVGRALEFLKGLKAALAAAAAKAPASLGVDGKAPGETVADALQSKSKRTFKEVLKGIGAFNQDEINDIVQTDGADSHWGLLPKAILALSYPKIKAALGEALAPAVAKIDKLIAACEQFEGCCRDAVASFKIEEVQAAGGESGDDAFSLLFATPDKIDETLCDADTLARFYKRTLKPIVLSRMELESSVAESIYIDDDMGVFIDEAVEDGTLEKLGSDKERDRGARSRFLKSLIQATRDNVSLSDEFMEEHFTFEKVLARNRVFWNGAYAAAQGSGIRRSQLEEKFMVTLGAVPEKDPNNPKAPPQLPETDKLMYSIAASLASTCAPWWITKTNGHSHGVMLFVPFDCNKNRVKFESHLKENAPHVTFQAFGTTDSKGGVTPFSFVAFVSEGIRLSEPEKKAGTHLLDKVTSLDYFKQPDVKKWLMMAEDPAGESIFTTENDNKGIGFISPLFVRDKQLSSYRWKPWTEDEVSVAASTENQALDILLYALLGTGLSEDRAKYFEEKLAPYGWSLPPLRFQEKGNNWFLTRKTLMWDDDGRKAVPNAECSWNKGKKVCTNTNNLLAMLEGKGKTGKDAARKESDVADGNKLKALLDTEADLFRTRIAAELGADMKELVEARNAWITEHRDAEDDDNSVYERLVQRFSSK